MFGTPACLLGILGELPETSDAAETQPGDADPAALDFWTRGMGLSVSAIPSAGPATRSAVKNAGIGSGFAREPIFLQYDENEKALITVDQINSKMLEPSGDAQVDFQLQRLRLNDEDEAHFARYTSGGIYLELQQSQPAQSGAASSGTSSGIISLASSVFSAFFPAKGAGGSKKGGSTSGGAKGLLQASPPAGTAQKGASAGAPVALQTAKQSQSLPLPNGAGKAAFSAFVKDPRKSAFGQFVGALTSAASGSGSYAQLLSIPLMASPALSAIRTIVANLQLHGANQEILMQGPPTDIAATASAFSSLNNPLPVRNGSYIVIPREQGPLLKPELSKVKIMNGFLVPKEATDLDVTPDLVQTLIPGLTYLSLGVSVKKTKYNSCSNSPQA
jgi:hypothetical protein